MSDARDDIFPTAKRPADRRETLEPADWLAESPEPPEPPAPPDDEVLLEFGSFREFIDDYSAHVSGNGMFLLGSPRRTGERVAFEVRLSDDFRLIHGTGTVEWSVPVSTPDRPSGAALRFTDLDEPSRRLVARLVDNHRESGGVPFDVDARPPEASGEGGAGSGTIEEPAALDFASEAPPLPIPETDFDAARTQIVKLPDDFPRQDAATLAESLEDSGFEPAELSHVSEAPDGDEPEEVLPVLPVDGPVDGHTASEIGEIGDVGEDPLDGYEPDAEPEPPAAIDDVAETGKPALVEMPDDEDLVGDYYRTSGPPRRGRTFLWVALCLLAVVLGAAAWRFQDLWTGLLPRTTESGPPSATESAPSEPDPPAEVGTEPAAATQPPADGVGEGEGDGPAPAEEAAADLPEPPPGPAATSPAPASAEFPATGLPGKLTDLASRVVGDGDGDGEITEILIATDTALAPDGFQVLRVSAPPARQVIKIYGPSEPFPREAVAVGSDHVRRLRTGLHRVDGRGEIHVVADLTGPGVVVLGTEIRGSVLIVRFGRR